MSELRICRFNDLGPDGRDQWVDLVRRQGLNPSLAPGWVEVCRDSIGGGDRDTLVFLARSADAKVNGVMPAFISSTRMMGARMTVLNAASNWMSYHAEVVAEVDRESFLGEVLAAAPRWDVFQMSGVDLDGQTAKAIMALAKRYRTAVQVIEGEASPRLRIEGTWDAYLLMKDKKFRYKWRKRRKLVEPGGSGHLVWHRGDDTVDQLLDDILAIERRSWKVSEARDIGSRTVELAYHRRLIPFLASQRTLLANVLHVSGRPVAYSLCCHDNGWIGLLKTSFDEGARDLSPGSLVIDAVVEEAFRLGAREFDFLGDAGAYKLAWASDVRSQGHFFLFAPRLKPRMVGFAKLVRGRFHSRNAETPPETTNPGHD